MQLTTGYNLYLKHPPPKPASQSANGLRWVKMLHLHCTQSLSLYICKKLQVCINTNLWFILRAD